MAQKYDIIIKDTHRGLLYEDGKLVRLLEAGRYEIRRPPVGRFRFALGRRPHQEIALVDIREHDLTIKG